MVTLWSPESGGTRSLGTIDSLPTFGTFTSSVSSLTNGVVETIAISDTILSELIRRTKVQASVSSESWGAFAFPCYVVAIRPIVAFTFVGAIESVSPRSTTIGTSVSCPTFGASALSRLFVARSVVLAATLVDAVFANCSFRALATKRLRGEFQEYKSK